MALVEDIKVKIDASELEPVIEYVRALESRVMQLEAQVAQLEAKQTPTIDYGAPNNTNEECERHTCSYYDFYLAQGPAYLTHEGYHAAERQCARAGKLLSDWLIEDQYRDDNRPIPPHLEREVQRWEKAIRA